MYVANGRNIFVKVKEGMLIRRIEEQIGPQFLVLQGKRKKLLGKQNYKARTPSKDFQACTCPEQLKKDVEALIRNPENL